MDLGTEVLLAVSIVAELPDVGLEEIAFKEEEPEADTDTDEEDAEFFLGGVIVADFDDVALEVGPLKEDAEAGRDVEDAEFFLVVATFPLFKVFLSSIGVLDGPGI